MFDPEQFLNALSLLVIKNGELIAEGYVQKAQKIACERARDVRH